MPSLGIDPAKTGAMLLGEGAQALAAVCWRQRGVGEDAVFDVAACGVHTETVTQTHGLLTAHAIACFAVEYLQPWIIGGGISRVACEDVYVGQNARGSLGLAKFAGGLVGPLGAWTRSGKPEWATAGQWRKPSFRRSWWKLQAVAAGKCASKIVAKRTGEEVMPKREAAKRESLLVMPKLVTDLDVLLQRLGRTDHLTDAAGVQRSATQ